MSDELQAKIEQYKSVLAQDPKSDQFLLLYEAYLQLGQADDALEVALKGSWESPQLPEAHVAVGRVYYQRGVQRKSEEAYFKALSFDQMCIPAYKGLARIYKDAGDTAKASDILTKAIMLDPGDASLQQMIESLSTNTGNSAPAAPQPAVSQEHTMDQTSDGMKPITTATIADIYIEQGLYDKAMEVYRELLTENPQDTDVQQRILELETMMKSGTPGAVEQPSAPAPVVENPSPSTPETLTSADPGAAQVGAEDAIEKLSNWLETIQARRNRV